MNHQLQTMILQMNTAMVLTWQVLLLEITNSECIASHGCYVWVFGS